MFFLFILLILYFITLFLEIHFIKSSPKKVNYNCNLCEIYDCPNKRCIKFRK